MSDIRNNGSKSFHRLFKSGSG